VVGLTEQHGVAEVGPTPSRPMHEVVRLEPSRSAAPREPAASIAEPKGPQHRARYSSSSPADPNRPPLLLQDPLDPGVARQPSNSVRGQSCSEFRLSEREFRLGSERPRI